MRTSGKNMACLSSRSQIVVPKPIRELLGIDPGDVIAFEERGGEVVIRPVRLASRDESFATFDEWASDADEEAYADP